MGGCDRWVGVMSGCCCTDKECCCSWCCNVEIVGGLQEIKTFPRH